MDISPCLLQLYISPRMNAHSRFYMLQQCYIYLPLDSIRSFLTHNNEDSKVCAVLLISQDGPSYRAYLLPECSPQSGRRHCCYIGSDRAARSAVFSPANKHPLCIQRHCLHLRRKVASYIGVILHSFQSEAKWKLTPIFIAPVVWIPDNFQQTTTSDTLSGWGGGRHKCSTGCKNTSHISIWSFLNFETCIWNSISITDLIDR